MNFKAFFALCFILALIQVSQQKGGFRRLTKKQQKANAAANLVKDATADLAATAANDGQSVGAALHELRVTRDTTGGVATTLQDVGDNAADLVEEKTGGKDNAAADLARDAAEDLSNTATNIGQSTSDALLQLEVVQGPTGGVGTTLQDAGENAAALLEGDHSAVADLAKDATADLAETTTDLGQSTGNSLHGLYAVEEGTAGAATTVQNAGDNAADLVEEATHGKGDAAADVIKDATADLSNTTTNLGQSTGDGLHDLSVVEDGTAGAATAVQDVGEKAAELVEKAASKSH